MQKRVFIVHGWGGDPEGDWLPWLKKQLEARGFEVVVPQLPNTEMPTINAWVPALAAEARIPDKRTFFVGHSMGCQAIARYLEVLPEGIKVGGAVFVAGFFKRLTGIEENEKSKAIIKEWLGLPLDLKKVRAHLAKSVAIFSDDDAYVPLDNQDEFRYDLGSKIIVQKKMGHFTERTGVLELPVALKAVLELAR